MSIRSLSCIILIDDKRFTVDSKELLTDKSPYFEALFSKKFKEGSQEQIILQDIDPDSFELLLEWCKTGSLDLSSLTSEAVVKLLKVSSILLFEAVTNACLKFVERSIENCDLNISLDLLQITEILNLEDIQQKCLRLCAERFQELNLAKVSKLDETVLLKLLDHPELFTIDDSLMIKVCETWANHRNRSPTKLIHRAIQIQNKQLRRLFENAAYSGKIQDLVNKDKEALLGTLEALENFQAKDSFSPEDMKDLSTHFDTNLRCCVLYPCVIGARVENLNPEADTVQSRDLKRDVVCYSIHPITNQMHKAFDLADIHSISEPTFPTGAAVVSFGSAFIVSGGEYRLGRNSWNLNIYKYSFPSGKCEVIGQLQQQRRHHTAQIIGDWMYMIGGFNKMRVKLDSMVKFNLNTGQQVECASLPVTVFKVAMVEFMGDLLVISGGILYSYSTQTDSWSQKTISSRNISGAMEFHTAVNADNIYLTSTYSRDIFKLRMDESQAELEKVGQFHFEAQNPVGAGSNIFNFYTDEFSDHRAVEAFNLKSGTSEVLMSKNDPTIEFNTLSNITALSLNRS